MPYKSQLVLGARIGGGQFGNVLEGHDPVHGKVAVKLLKQKPDETTTDWARRSEDLLKEALHLKAATHANVVQVHNIVKDSTNDVVHLVAEFCDGGSVEAEYKNGPLSLPTIREIITDACRGLEHIHSCGMIHRDIKPANILRHGKRFKIADFGLVSDDLLLGYASADGYVAHLAPEVFPDPARGKLGTTSPKTDVWAMGMTAYRLLTGHEFYIQRFAGKDIKGMICGGNFNHRLEWLPHVPEAWRKYVRKAMHDDTTQRFQSARAMGQGLASLPISPAWTCQLYLKRVRWELKEGNRTIAVTWTIHSPRKHEWVAVRAGGSKREMTVGGQSGKIVTSGVARTQLENFFAKWT